MGIGSIWIMLVLLMNKYGQFNRNRIFKNGKRIDSVLINSGFYLAVLGTVATRATPCNNPFNPKSSLQNK